MKRCCVAMLCCLLGITSLLAAEEVPVFVMGSVHQNADPAHYPTRLYCTDGRKLIRLAELAPAGLGTAGILVDDSIDVGLITTMISPGSLQVLILDLRSATVSSRFEIPVSERRSLKSLYPSFDSTPALLAQHTVREGDRHHWPYASLDPSDGRLSAPANDQAARTLLAGQGRVHDFRNVAHDAEGAFQYGGSGERVSLGFAPPQALSVGERLFHVLYRNAAATVIVGASNRKHGEAETVAVLDSASSRWTQIDLPSMVASARVFGRHLYLETTSGRSRDDGRECLRNPQFRTACAAREAGIPVVSAVRYLHHLDLGTMTELDFGNDDAALLGIKHDLAVVRIGQGIRTFRLGELTSMRTLVEAPEVGGIHWLFWARRHAGLARCAGLSNQSAND